MIIECAVEKLVFGGQALVWVNGKALFLWGALPGEKVRVSVTKQKKDYLLGEVLEVLEASPWRSKPSEDHFLSCSPWQIMAFEEENRWKSAIAQEVFNQFSGVLLQANDIVHDDRTAGYRNKMEYSFWDQQDCLRYAFFKRNTKYRYPIDHCTLAVSSINTAAEEMRDWLQGLHSNHYELKSLILRTAQNGEVVSALFVKDRTKFMDCKMNFRTMKGCAIYYSDPRSPFSRPDELLYQFGATDLTDTVLEKQFMYGPLSFFQVNVPLFEYAVRDMERFIDLSDEVVDYYSGVGAIGLSLSPKYQRGILVEEDQQATHYAKKNIAFGQVDHVQAIAGKAEVLCDEIQNHRVIIFDPPRVGLHPRIISKVHEALPRRILYLSCNIATQARDIKLFTPGYHLIFSRLYNFFPRTPHFESLCVLDRD